MLALEHVAGRDWHYLPRGAKNEQRDRMPDRFVWIYSDYGPTSICPSIALCCTRRDSIKEQEAAANPKEGNCDDSRAPLTRSICKHQGKPKLPTDANVAKRR